MSSEAAEPAKMMGSAVKSRASRGSTAIIRVKLYERYMTPRLCKPYRMLQAISQLHEERN